jgi:hypothetical protein
MCQEKSGNPEGVVTNFAVLTELQEMIRKNDRNVPKIAQY